MIFGIIMWWPRTLNPNRDQQDNQRAKDGVSVIRTPVHIHMPGVWHSPIPLGQKPRAQNPSDIHPCTTLSGCPFLSFLKSCNCIGLFDFCELFYKINETEEGVVELLTW